MQLQTLSDTYFPFPEDKSNRGGNEDGLADGVYVLIISGLSNLGERRQTAVPTPSHYTSCS